MTEVTSHRLGERCAGLEPSGSGARPRSISVMLGPRTQLAASGRSSDGDAVRGSLSPLGSDGLSLGEPVAPEGTAKRLPGICEALGTSMTFRELLVPSESRFLLIPRGSAAAALL